MRLNCSAHPVLCNQSLMESLIGDGASLVPSDVSFGIRVFISLVYSVVSAVGLLGNGLVMYLIWSQKSRSASAINIFVFGLTMADFQLSLTLPFWAVEVALDFSWPFGEAMCKAVPSLTILSVYANAFLLTTMSVTRYWTVATALKAGSQMAPHQAKWITMAVWALALGASLPTIIYATVSNIAGEELCLVKIPTEYGLGIYLLHRVIFTFVVPLVIISVSYLLLLRLLKAHQVSGNNPKCQNQVATTIRLLVASFFICWFPNHVVTIWSVLVKFHVVSSGRAFYFFQTYVYPFAICLVHVSSCLNPVLYCLTRKEYQEAMKETFWKLSTMASFYCCSSAYKTGEEEAAFPLSLSENPSEMRGGKKEHATFSTFLELRTKELNQAAEVGLMPGVEMPM